MIHYKTSAEIEVMRKSCLLVSACHAAVVPYLKAGVTTKYMNELIATFISDNAGIPSFLNYGGFPAATCISVNEIVVHGIPSDYVLKDGDIITLDIGILKNGFHGDSAYTYAIGEISDDIKKLLKVTKESLYKGVAEAREGRRIGDIAFAIQEHTEKKNGYGVVRDLVGHGLGRKLHEDPQVPNYGRRGSGQKLKSGMVLAIEPMINMGVKDVDHHQDGWTITTKDKKYSAHFEHDVHVTKKGPDILTSFENIEQAEKANKNLFWSYD